MTNDELTNLKKIALGDHDAFQSLFIKYFPKIKYFIGHIIKSDFIAEELSQDIFLKIWENREKLPNIHSINSYLYRMAKHIAINHLERRFLENSYMEAIQYAESPNLEEELEASELEFMIQLTVDRMPEQRRNIYTMSRVENIKNGKIAETLGITEKTVNNQLSLALNTIRKLISSFLLFFL